MAPLLMGEWGGFMDGGKNEQWMTYLRDFMIENRIHHTFWCFNENSGDTGGLVYDNFGKWDEDKYALVKPALWQDDNGKFISLDHTIALGANGISLSDYYGSGNSSTTTPDSKIIAGDVNSDKLVNGVDLTLMRQNITKCWDSFEIQNTVPSHVQPEEAVISCTWREVLGAFKDFNLTPGKKVIVVGSGPVGLSFVKLGKLFGLGQIDIVDMLPAKLEVARRMGADNGYSESGR